MNNLAENYQEIITSHAQVFLPEQVNPEMEWAKELEKLVLEIKENIMNREEMSKQLENIQPEIEELLAKLAEKQAEEEKIKADIKTAEEECAQYKERLFEASGQ